MEKLALPGHANARSIRAPTIPSIRPPVFSSRFRMVALTATTAAALASIACASGAGTREPAEAAPAGMSFDEALLADSSTFEPPAGFRAVAEVDWVQAAIAGSVAGTVVENSKWKLGDGCEIHFTPEADVLAATESPPVPTKKLSGDACRGRTGFWQMSAGRVYFWMPLAGGWSAEYYGDFADDSTMLLRRYPMRRTANRTWRPDRDNAIVSRASRIMEVKVAARPTYPVTSALRAVGEPDWSTRPGYGTAASVSGTRWRAPNGCVLTFAASVLARASNSQRLTRSLTSTECDGLKGSWQQVGKRVFWLVNLDSLTAVETYADVADTVMRARVYDLRRASSKEAFQGTWDPTRAHSLTRVRR
jgi:hypothetical protein